MNLKLLFSVQPSTARVVVPPPSPPVRVIRPKSKEEVSSSHSASGRSHSNLDTSNGLYPSLASSNNLVSITVPTPAELEGLQQTAGKSSTALDVPEFSTNTINRGSSLKALLCKFENPSTGFIKAKSGTDLKGKVIQASSAAEIKHTVSIRSLGLSDSKGSEGKDGEELEKSNDLPPPPDSLLCSQDSIIEKQRSELHFDDLPPPPLDEGLEVE